MKGVPVATPHAFSIKCNNYTAIQRMKETKCYEVGGHRFRVTAEGEYQKLMENYEPFATADFPETEHCAFVIDISTDTIPPDSTEIIRQEDEGQTIVFSKIADGRNMLEFSLVDTTAGWLLCTENYREATLITTGQYTKLAVDNALMIMYALSTAREKTLLFHAAVVSYGGHGYMFLGPSGTGKSTHARLWLQHIAGTQLVNDDNPVVRVNSEGIIMVYGSPWSGKTPCYRNESYPLGGIVKLRQAPFNKIGRLRGIHAYAALISSISGTRWNPKIADGLHETEQQIAKNVPVWYLECLPDMEAAELCALTVTTSI